MGHGIKQITTGPHSFLKACHSFKETARLENILMYSVLFKAYAIHVLNPIYLPKNWFPAAAHSVG
jgi:hypothetical protein